MIWELALPVLNIDLLGGKGCLVLCHILPTYRFASSLWRHLHKVAVGLCQNRRVCRSTATSIWMVSIINCAAVFFTWLKLQRQGTTMHWLSMMWMVFIIMRNSCSYLTYNQSIRKSMRQSTRRLMRKSIQNRFRKGPGSPKIKSISVLEPFRDAL